MKKLVTLLSALAIFLTGFSSNAYGSAGRPSMYNFTLRYTYTDNRFWDVDEAQWYGTKRQAVIKKAYELGIVNGVETGAFYPEDALRLCEAIKMAAVVHSIYSADGALFDISKQPWYGDYVDYAIRKGIIAANHFSNYDAYASRADVAYIFEKTLPFGELWQINTINSIPGVSTNTPNSDSIFTLYRAGVLSGDEGSLNFRPYDMISRAEAAAIITRLALPENRRFFEILPSNADVKYHGPEYAVFDLYGRSIGLGYQSEYALKPLNELPMSTEKSSFAQGTSEYFSEYTGFGRVRYLRADYPAGGIYVFGIYVTSADYKLENGIRCGSTRRDLVSVYGDSLQQFEYDPSSGLDFGYAYYPGSSSPWYSIVFTIAYGKVSEIILLCSPT